MNIEIFILAGGKSSRMGTDKGTLLIHNKEMIKHIVDMLHFFEFPVRIIANQEIYHKFGVPVFADLVKEKGAMGGLCTALKNTIAQRVLILPCDMPFLPKELIFELVESQKIEKYDCWVAQIHEKINPLLAVYDKSLLPKIEDLIAKNQLKMQDFIFSTNYKLLNMNQLAEKNANFFQNINTPQQLSDIL